MQLKQILEIISNQSYRYLQIVLTFVILVSAAVHYLVKSHLTRARAHTSVLHYKTTHARIHYILAIDVVQVQFISNSAAGVII
jgi:hypothetical protein